MRKTLKPPLLGYYTMAGGEATPWYLSGGISAADCVAAYLAKGAASYAASKANLTGNTDYDLTENDGAVTWDADTGWEFSADNAKLLLTGYTPVHPVSVIARFSDLTGSIYGPASVFDVRYIYYDEEEDDDITITVIAARADGFHGLVYNNIFVSAMTPAPSGVFCVTPEAGYLSGALVDSIGATSLDAYGVQLPIGGYLSNEAARASNLKIQALAIYNRPLSDVEVGLLTTAMYAL